MRHLRVLIAGVFVCFLCQSVQAQSYDILGELDEEMEAAEAEGAEKAEAEGNYAEQLVGNITGKLRLRGRRYLDRPKFEFLGFDVTRLTNVDRRSTFGEAMLELDTHIGKADAWRIDFSGWLEYGNDEDRWAGTTQWMQDDRRSSSIFEPDELYLTIFGDALNFTVGKKVFKNGISTIYSPSNRYTCGDLNDPLYPKELGVWQAAIDLFASDRTTITGVIFPVYQRPRLPSRLSRWFGSGDDFDLLAIDIPDFALDVIYRETPVPIEMENVSYLGRITTSVNGWDLFFSAYHGNSAYWTVDGYVIGGDLVVFEKKITRVNNFAAGFSTTHKSLEVHAEVLYNDSNANRDDDYLNGVVGFTLNSDKVAEALLMEQVVATIEFVGEVETRERDKIYYVTAPIPLTMDYSSEITRVGRKDIIANLVLKVNDKVSLRVLSHNDFREGGHLQRFTLRWTPIDNLAFTLDHNMLTGSASSYYGRWKENDGVVLTVDYSF